MVKLACGPFDRSAIPSLVGGCQFYHQTCVSPQQIKNLFVQGPHLIVSGREFDGVVIRRYELNNEQMV